jgi:hypothetical protein
MSQDDPKAWMKRKFSIKLQFSHVGTNWYSFTTAEPFEATAEEADTTLNNLRSKIQSIIVSHRADKVAVAGMQLFERYAVDFGTDVTVRIDECIIPPIVLTSSFIRYTLVEHN